MGMFKCKSCGAAILWITTKAGKMMPCDGKMFYGKTPGTDTLVTRDGKVVRCTVTNDMNVADVSGWVPHFATCPQAASHRKKTTGGMKPKTIKRQPNDNRQMNMFEMMR